MRGQSRDTLRSRPRRNYIPRVRSGPTATFAGTSLTEGVRWPKVPVHANNTGHWRAEKFPVAQDCSCMSRRVFARDSHRTVDLSAQLGAEMLKRRGQGRIFGGRRWASSIRAATRRSRDAPDANTICHGWILEFDGAYWAKARASHQLPRHRLGQKQPCRMALSDRLIKVQHGSDSPDGRDSIVRVLAHFLSAWLGRFCYLQGRCAATGFSHSKHLTCTTF